MIDWDALESADDSEELKKIKAFLFQESLRLQAQSQDLQEEKKRLVQMQEDFLRDRVRLRDELNELNAKTLSERKKLRQENQFFDKKMEILKAGFQSLEADRLKFEREKREYAASKGATRCDLSDASIEAAAAYLFRTIDSPIGFRKRYRDLVKIFHPDNMFGDEELCQAINREYHKKNKPD